MQPSVLFAAPPGPWQRESANTVVGNGKRAHAERARLLKYRLALFANATFKGQPHSTPLTAKATRNCKTSYACSPMRIVKRISTQVRTRNKYHEADGQEVMSKRQFGILASESKNCILLPCLCAALASHEPRHHIRVAACSTSRPQPCKSTRAPLPAGRLRDMRKLRS